MRGAQLLATVSLLSGWTSARAAEGDVKLTVDTGYDSNVRRDYDQTDTGTVSDVVMSVLGSAQGKASAGPAQAFGVYDLGLRKFLHYPSEDTLVQAGTAEGAVAATDSLSVGVGGRGKDRRGGVRDYTDLSTDAFLAFSPDPTLELRLWAGAHRFMYWDNFAYSFSAPEAGLTGRYRFSRRHSVFFTADAGLRSYNSQIQTDPSQTPPDPLPVRKDTAFNVSAGYSFRGPVTLTVAYSYFEQDSNSFGESLGRHRVAATLAARLPGRLFLLAEGALQYTRYPDGIYLSPEILLTQDEENTNALSLKLVRPLDAHVDAEAHYGLYHNHLPTNGLTYWRQVGWLGLTWRL